MHTRYTTDSGEHVRISGRDYNRQLLQLFQIQIDGKILPDFTGRVKCIIRVDYRYIDCGLA